MNNQVTELTKRVPDVSLDGMNLIYGSIDGKTKVISPLPFQKY